MTKSIRRYEFSGCSADIGFAEFVGCGDTDEWNMEAVAISPLMCVVSSDTSHISKEPKIKVRFDGKTMRNPRTLARILTSKEAAELEVELIEKSRSRMKHGMD